MKHGIIMLLCLFLFVCRNVSAQAPYGKYDFIGISQYPFIKIINDSSELKISDKEFYRRASKVVFPVNKFELPKDSPFVKMLENTILPKINEYNLELQHMMLRGAASPEGPFKWNTFLSQHREQNLFNFINSKLKNPLEESKYTHSNIPEDYIYLCEMMKEAGDSDYEIVKEIVEKHLRRDKNGELLNEQNQDQLRALKLELQKHSNGTLWKRMLKEYFPSLRAARVMLFFKQGKTEESLPAYVYTSDSIDLRDNDIWVPERLTRRHIIALKTNLIYDFFYMPGYGFAPSPNIQLEYYPKRGHLTLNLGFTCPYWHDWSHHRFWQIRDYDIELRRYFKGGGQFYGPYIGINGHFTKYGIGFNKNEGWEGEGGGAGINFGWVWHLSRNKRWRLEASIGVGYFATVYDPYVFGNPYDGSEDGLYYYDFTGIPSQFKKRNHIFQWFGPTQIGIHLTYDILYRRINKKGVSFKRTEPTLYYPHLYQPTEAEVKEATFTPGEQEQKGGVR